MRSTIYTLICLFTFIACNDTNKSPLVLDISGSWTVALDSTDIGLTESWHNKVFDQTIMLPGTTDDAQLGVKNTLIPKLEQPQLSHLTRKNSYLGAAWYTRTIVIPENWEGKRTSLKLERVIWKSNVWIDGKPISEENNSLIAPHYFDMSKHLEAGKTHQITIRIDNRKLFDISVRNLAHAYTNDTQIIWNGVIGKMAIEAEDPLQVTNLQVYPDIATKKIKVVASVNHFEEQNIDADLSIKVMDKQSKKYLPTIVKHVNIEGAKSSLEVEYDMGNDAKLWSEFTPELYSCEVELKSEKYTSTKMVDFGMRSFTTSKATIEVNGSPAFLRGTLECNIFPLTGHPPMTKDGWYKVFNTAKEWGLNHLRFHSWCPPKAAFEVADELGFYLQVELPAWTLTIGKDQATTDFLYAESQRIIAEYGNHPSFCMWSLGNELQGDMSVLHAMVDTLKKQDNRHLYSNTAFTFEKGHGDWPEDNDDYFITQWTKKGWVRGQGVFNDKSPSFNNNYESAVEGMTVPLITHEIGQYAVYPNLEEIEKYTGVLDPLNFKAVKQDLEKKGLIHKAENYTLASGKLAALLYKEEIERTMKTGGISGFQLLDLHDFPGQGTALVGLLDAFWESKGLIEASTFRQFTAPVVPLLNFSKATYTNNEKFVANIEVSNYSASSIENQKIEWNIYNGTTNLATGSFVANLNLGYNSKLETFEFDLSTLTVPSKLRVEVKLEGTEYQNNWNVWIYPSNQKIDYGTVTYTRHLSEAMKSLEKGENVLLNPDRKSINGIEGKFVPVFWSPVHFPKQAGTMGMLANPTHAALKLFPTEMHTDWQWWDLNINSTTMIVDSLDGGDPIVEMIDNFNNNRKLALIYEGAVLNGKLLIVSSDLATDIEERYVAKQLLVSLLTYMNSKDFSPSAIKNPSVLSTILGNELKDIKKKMATDIY